MQNVARFSDKERKELFAATAAKMGLHESVVEKDFWVCFLLNHLFHDSEYKDAFVFKGGTSLSKAYHIIERFSEDIDLILDWRKIDYKTGDAWKDRSKNQQDKFNKEMNAAAARFYKNALIPKLNEELEAKLGLKNLFKTDENDEMIVQFAYPPLFHNLYLRSYVQLEIGPIAEWLPSHEVAIKSFAAEQYPRVFQVCPESLVRTVDVERTFWEKITILHKIANFPKEKTLPKRYARHLYDVYKMGKSKIKEMAFAKRELLDKYIAFKQKFYYSKNARYETAVLNSVKLLPESSFIDELRSDYHNMLQMIYGDKPDFDEIIDYLQILEKEIHSLEKE